MGFINKDITIGEKVWTVRHSLYATPEVFLFKVKNKTDKNIAVVKLYVASTNDALRKKAKKEAKLHSLLEHEHLIEYKASVDYDSHFCILMSYAPGGTLYKQFNLLTGMRRATARSYFRQLLSGVSYMHAQGIAHGDIKFQNLLVDAEKKLKICDFGESRRFRSERGERLTSTDRYGTRSTTAPEVLVKRRHCPARADIWSCGILLVCMFTFKKPWKEPWLKDKDYKDWLQRQNCNGVVWKQLSPLENELVSWMLQVDPKLRAALSQIRQHPWLTRKERMVEANRTEKALSFIP